MIQPVRVQFVRSDKQGAEADVVGRVNAPSQKPHSRQIYPTEGCKHSVRTASSKMIVLVTKGQEILNNESKDTTVIL